MIRYLLILLLLLPAPQTSPDLTVQAQDGRVTVLARAVPLKEVLDRISRETGLEVFYEGPEPSPLITVTIKDRPEREALLGILEGLGLNHALQMDIDGLRVEMLIIEAAYGSGPATAMSRGPTTAGQPRRQARPPNIPGRSSPADTGPGEEFLDPDGLPYLDAPYDDASDPAWSDTSEDEWLDEAPDFPADASSPIPPGSVPYPLFPGAASD
jgi:hypothetical protein